MNMLSDFTTHPPFILCCIDGLFCIVWMPSLARRNKSATGEKDPLTDESAHRMAAQEQVRQTDRKPYRGS